MTPERALEHRYVKHPTQYGICGECGNDIERHLVALDTALALCQAENDRLTLAASESARTLQVEIATQQEQAGMVIGELKARVAELQGLNEQLNRHEHELSDQVTALREALKHYVDDCPSCWGHPGVRHTKKGGRGRHTNRLENIIETLCEDCEPARTALAALPQDGS